jgi:AcrR family transcriptional regulator
VVSEAEAPNPTPQPGAPLPRGRHDLPPETVERHQRDRIVAAVAEIMAQRGYPGLTVGRIIGLARVSRTTFYAHFPNKQEAVVGSHEQIFEAFLTALIASCSAEADWPLKVRAAISAAVDFAVGNPEQSQMLSTGLLTADAGLASRISGSYDRLAALLEGIRPHSPHAARLPDCTEEFLVAAIAASVAMATGRLIKGDAESLGSLRADLTELTLIPYCGIDEATRLAGREG